MARAPWCGEEVYAEAARFRDECLIEDGSLITPSLQVWTQERVDALETLVTPIDSGRFIENLVNQLQGHTDEDKQLAAEALYLAFIFDAQTKAETAKNQVEQVLATTGARREVPSRMVEILGAGGVANLAQAAHLRWAHVDGVLQLARNVKALAPQERASVFGDPWSAKQVIGSAFGSKAAIAAKSLLHLLYPDTFEYLVGPGPRTEFVRAFAGAANVADEPDQDRQILAIRKLVQLGEEQPIDLFSPALSRAWKIESAQWDKALGFTEKLLGEPEFEKEEVEYKLEIGAVLSEARDAVLVGTADWESLLRRAMTHSSNNLLYRPVAVPVFLEWVEQDTDTALAAFRALWSDGDVEARIEEFLALVPRDAVSGAGSRLSFATFFLLGQDPTGVPFFKPTAVTNFRRALGEPQQFAVEDEETPTEEAVPDGAPDEVGQYRAWCELVDEFRWRMLAATGSRPDRLHAQSAAWTLTQWPVETVPGEWTEQERAELAAWRKGGEPVPHPDEQEPDGGEIVGSEPTAVLPPITQHLDDKTHLTMDWLEEIWSLLDDKRQLILYGPPGTGKTFLAIELGEHVQKAGGEYRLVQFHPSYTYEDFFEGYRPRAENGGLEFDLVSGTLKELAESAHENQDQPHLLVIDEINRGNLPKIFGELYFLLEYRDKKVRLQYSREEFSLPPNLYVIGTMNTADKSIALVDAALRRRFYFAGMLPTEEPVRSVLPRWLKDRTRVDAGFDPLSADLLNELNARIADADFSIGPSYLMSDPDLERVWTYSILPLLEEHFYSRGRDVPAEFGLAAIRKGLESAEQ